MHISFAYKLTCSVHTCIYIYIHEWVCKHAIELGVPQCYYIVEVVNHCLCTESMIQRDSPKRACFILLSTPKHIHIVVCVCVTYYDLTEIWVAPCTCGYILWIILSYNICMCIGICTVYIYIYIVCIYIYILCVYIYISMDWFRGKSTGNPHIS